MRGILVLNPEGEQTLELGFGQRLVVLLQRQNGYRIHDFRTVRISLQELLEVAFRLVVAALADQGAGQQQLHLACLGIAFQEALQKGDGLARRFAHHQLGLQESSHFPFGPQLQGALNLVQGAFA